jgi:hypothetical protein
MSNTNRITVQAKRLALAAILSSAALAAIPALANAESTCTYSPNAFPEARVDVFDASGSQSLVIGRAADSIAISNGGVPVRLCVSPVGTVATVFNTDKIFVHGTAASNEEFPFIIYQQNGALAPGKTPEPDGNSELETIINNDVPVKRLDVKGTSGPDVMRVSSFGGVMLGSDNDVDIRAGDARIVRLEGEGGSDFLSGRGGFPNSTPAPATTNVEMYGADVVASTDTGDNTLVDGPLGGDLLKGADGNDTLFSADGQNLDLVDGGDGFDTATIDSGDHVFDVERLTTVVGRLKLNPTAVKARAGRPARITLAWKHPKSWKQLRSLRLTANDAGNVVASVQIDPARARITAHGALEVTPRSTVTHHGKWVTARAWLRPSQRLAGHTLRLAVQATDVHSHQQLEPFAGTLTVTK